MPTFGIGLDQPGRYAVSVFKRILNKDGCKELLTVEDGYRESADSWAVVFRDLAARGMNAPKLVTGDGALGAWAALRDVFPTAREQKCWVHKTANVLDAMPERLQPRAKSLLHEMAEAPTEADARAARERFRTEFDAKHPKATAKLDKDWDALTAFFDSLSSTGATSGQVSGPLLRRVLDQARAAEGRPRATRNALPRLPRRVRCCPGGRPTAARDTCPRSTS
jgi:transposase-like protein